MLWGATDRLPQGGEVMPRKGTKKSNPTGRTKPRVTLTPHQQVVDLLSKVAFDEQFKNPRNGKVNITQAVEHIALIYRAYSRFYPKDMPFPQSLCAYLLKRVAAGDKEAQNHLDYIESWGIERDVREAIAGGAIKVGDNYIV